MALALRLIFLGELRRSPTYDHPEGGDSILYDAIASGAAQPVRAYFHSPLYQGFLDGLYAIVGRELTLVRLLQHALGGVTVLLVWWTAQLLFGEGAALIAGVGFALLGPPIFFEGQLLVDAIMPLLVVLVFLTTLLYWRQPSRRRALICGATVGVAALARGVALFWWPLLLLMAWRKGRLPHALALSGALLLPIVPVTIHNYRAEHDFVLITANAGLNLYVGNSPTANGAYVLPAGLWFTPGDPSADFSGFSVAARELGHMPSSAELSSWWARRASAYARANPLRELELAVAKLKLLVSNYEYPQLYNYYGYQTICPLLRVLPTAGWLIAPGLVGLALACWRSREAQLAAALAVIYALSFVPFFVVDRYRCAWLSLLAPFAGLALAELVRSLRAREWETARALGGGLLIAGGLTLLPVNRLSVAPQYFFFAEACLATGAPADAVSWYRRAAAADPLDARVQANMGIALSLLGQNDQARSALERAAQLWPGSERTQNNLGLVYLRLGRPVDAERCFRAAIRLNPSIGEAYVSLGDLLAARGDLRHAKDAFITARLLAPADARVAIAARLDALARQQSP